MKKILILDSINDAEIKKTIMGFFKESVVVYTDKKEVPAGEEIDCVFVSLGDVEYMDTYGDQFFLKKIQRDFCSSGTKLFGLSTHLDELYGMHDYTNNPAKGYIAVHKGSFLGLLDPIESSRFIGKCLEIKAPTETKQAT